MYTCFEGGKCDGDRREKEREKQKLKQRHIRSI